MTKELAVFVNGLRCGFISVKQGLELRSIDRLCPVLVRCQSVRFVCAVQDLSTMIARMRAAGDEVRDVSVTSGVLEEARKFIGVPAVKPWAISKAMSGVKAAIKAEPFVCECGKPGRWHGDRAGRRVLCCDQCWENQYRAVIAPFNESDCGGAFDGNQVISDADPGL
jgi:hypothetical protein